MAKLQSQRKSCKDVFNAFLVRYATYSGRYDFPRILADYHIPDRLIAFSKALSSKDYNQWVHFFQDDYSFERIWRNPKRYLKILKRFNGVILPDFSLYRDMPFVMQLWNIYRSRAIGHWLQINGVRVIPNIRYGDSRTFGFCCDGIAKKSVIAVGSNGTMKHKEDREIFLQGFDRIIKTLQPSIVVVYGSLHNKYFQKYVDAGIRIVHFESNSASSHKESA